MRTVQHSQGEVNIIRICVMTEYRGGFDERRTLYYIFLLEVGRTKAYVHPSPDVATTSLAIFLRPAVCIFFWTQIGRPTGRGYAGEGWTHRGVNTTRAAMRIFYLVKIFMADGSLSSFTQGFIRVQR